MRVGVERMVVTVTVTDSRMLPSHVHDSVLGDYSKSRVSLSMKAFKPARMLSTRRLGVVIVSGEISVLVTGHVVDFVSLKYL
jgi:hypothetical protein